MRLRRRELGQSRVMREIDLFATREVQDIAVLDPIFNAGARSNAILGRFAEHGFAGRLSLQCRFEMVDDEFLALCQALRVRLEFGLQTIHRVEQKAIERPNHLARVESVIADLHARGIPFEVSLIYGLP